MGRGLRTVGRAEGIKHKHVAQGGIGLAQFWVIGFFAHVHAHVLQHHHLACFGSGFDIAPVVGDFDVLVEQFAQTLGYR